MPNQVESRTPDSRNFMIYWHMTPSGIQSMQGRIEMRSIVWQTQEKEFSIERVPM